MTENIHFSAAAHWVIFKEENSIINMSTKIKDKQENGGEWLIHYNSNESNCFGGEDPY